jgi:hypothetical protein
MVSRQALLGIAPAVAVALEAGDMERMVGLIRQRFPNADVKAVLDELGRLNSVQAAEVLLAAGNVEGAIARLGRNDAPAALRNWHEAGRIDVQQLRQVLLGVWELVEFPCRALPRRTWLGWFERVGFVSDSGAAMPTEATEVWRAQVGRVLGLSWSRDREKAMWFHKRNVETWRFPETRLLRTFAPPAAILALVDEGRGEREVLVHPRRFSSAPTAERT